MAYKKVGKVTEVSNSFQESKERGQVWELEVAKALVAAGYRVRNANMTEQMLGIDIFATSSNKHLKLECKLDQKAEETGNLFIEVTSGEKLGCIFTTKSDYLIISVGASFILVKPLVLRLQFANDSDRLSMRVCHNPNGYSSSGVLFKVSDPRLTEFTHPISSLVEVLRSLTDA